MRMKAATQRFLELAELGPYSPVDPASIRREALLERWSTFFDTNGLLYAYSNADFECRRGLSLCTVSANPFRLSTGDHTSERQ